IPPVRLQPIPQADRKSSGARDPLIPLNPCITNPRMKDDPQWVGICKLPGPRHGGANHIYLGNTGTEMVPRFIFALRQTPPIRRCHNKLLSRGFGE
ncbi:hypothetical protein CDAR_235541, partial [Caerostris darwini]